MLNVPILSFALGRLRVTMHGGRVRRVCVGAVEVDRRHYARLAILHGGYSGPRAITKKDHRSLMIVLSRLETWRQRVLYQRAARVEKGQRKKRCDGCVVGAS